MWKSSWLAEKVFSFWYWKSGGPVKKPPCTFHIHKMRQFSCLPQFWTLYYWLALWASDRLTLSSWERFGEIKKGIFVETKIVPRKDLKNSQFDNTPASGLNCAEGGCVRIRTIIREFVLGICLLFLIVFFAASMITYLGVLKSRRLKNNSDYLKLNIKRNKTK